MVTKDTVISATLEDVQNTMAQAKYKLKTRETLRNVTALSPIINNESRWAGRYFVLNRYLIIRNKLLETDDTDGVPFHVSISIVAKNCVERLEKICMIFI